MKNKVYRVIEKPSSKHEYDIEVEERKEGTLYILKACNGSDWTEHTKGQILVSILDHGNGVKILGGGIRKDGSVDYDVIEEIRILLNFRNKVEKYSTSYEILGEPLYKI